jgi:hypothetical protein
MAALLHIIDSVAANCRVVQQGDTLPNEKSRFSAKIVAIQSLETPARKPKPTSPRPIRMRMPKRR